MVTTLSFDNFAKYNNECEDACIFQSTKKGNMGKQHFRSWLESGTYSLILLFWHVVRKLLAVLLTVETVCSPRAMLVRLWICAILFGIHIDLQDRSRSNSGNLRLLDSLEQLKTSGDSGLNSNALYNIRTHVLLHFNLT